MKKLLLTLPLFILLIASCSKPDPIVNTWTVESMSLNGVNEANLDPQSKMIVDQMKQAVVGGVYNFRENGTYSFNFNAASDSGTYRFSDDKKTLFLKNAKNERDYEVLSFTNEKMEWTRSDKKAVLTLKSSKK
jgi:Lipocalin-like domain